MLFNCVVIIEKIYKNRQHTSCPHFQNLLPPGVNPVTSTNILGVSMLVQPVETRQNPSRPVETRRNMLQPVETRFNPFRSVQTRLNLSKHVTTRSNVKQHLSWNNNMLCIKKNKCFPTVLLLSKKQTAYFSPESFKGPPGPPSPYEIYYRYRGT